MKLARLLAAKARGRPAALCDGGDVDGIASAALFKRRHPGGVVLLAGPGDVRRWWVRAFTWDFVADLPCPGRARLRADHHRTNRPCADVEFYDPEAPAAALLAARALGLDGDPIAAQLVEAAVQTDTADVRDPAVRDLDLAVRYGREGEKLAAVDLLAREGLAALGREPLRSMAERGRRLNQLVLEIAARVPPERELAIYSPAKLPISYRALAIELQRRGAAFVNILVRRGARTFRLYCGAQRDGPHDCTAIARALGGGGHRFAAGATARGPLWDWDRPLQAFLALLRPRTLYVLGGCTGVKYPCEAVDVMTRGSGDPMSGLQRL